MNKQTQALKLALEALEDAKKNHGLVYVTELCAIREALAEQPAQQQCMEHGECFGGECIYPAQQPAQQQEPQPPYEFERYVAGSLRAQGVRVERATTLADAMRIAAKICPPANPPSAPTVLVYTSPPAQQQESCGWRMRHNGVWAYSFTKDAWDFIYAVSPAARKAARDNAPASKPWVGLTDEERLAVVHYSQLDNAKAIEAKLKEKNNG